MEISRADLLSAVKACVVALNNTDALGSHCIHFDKDGSITTFNDYLGVRVQLPIDFTADIEGMLLYKALQNFKDETVKITLKEDGVEFKCGRSKTTLRLQDVPLARRVQRHLPNANETVAYDVQPDFTENLVRGRLKDHDKTKGVYVSGDRIVSAFGKDQIYYSKFKGDLPDFRLHPQAVDVLRSYTVNKVWVLNGWVYLETERINLLCRMMEFDYTLFDKLNKMIAIFENGDTLLEGDCPDDLYNAIKTSISFTDSSVPYVCLSFNVAGVDVYVDNHGTSFCESLDCTFKLESDSIEIALVPWLLTTVLQKVKGVIKIQCAMSNNLVMMLESEDSTMLIWLGEKQQ